MFVCKYLTALLYDVACALKLNGKVIPYIINKIKALIGINKIYDLHFASISKQVNTIEEINDQTRGLAAKIQEVNDVYAQMIKKLTAISNPLANS